MKPIGVVQVLAGIVAIIGAVGLAFVLITVGQAIGTINSASAADFPDGTDISTLQDTAQSLGTLILFGWVWVIAVLLSGIFSVRAGIGSLRYKKSFARK